LRIFIYKKGNISFSENERIKNNKPVTENKAENEFRENKKTCIDYSPLIIGTLGYKVIFEKGKPNLASKSRSP